MKGASPANFWLLILLGLAVFSCARCETDDWDDLDRPVQPVPAKPKPADDGPQLNMFAKSSTEPPK